MRLFFRPRSGVAAPVGLPSRPGLAVREVAPPPVPRPRPLALPRSSERVIPAAVKLAVDADMAALYQGQTWSGGAGFPGYAALAELCQCPEYRRPAEIMASEMTRKWLRLVAIGDSDAGAKAEKVRALTAAFQRLKVREVFRQAAEQDGFFGRSQIFLELDGGRTPPEELDKPLLETPAKLGKGITALRVIEPLWTYPAGYNAADPLRDDYFQPDCWYVQGRKVHASRLLTLVSRPVPDLLKPAYCFGGLSLSQMMKPYVDNWLHTRQSVADSVYNFSTSVLKTNMAGILEGGAATALWQRVKLFTQMRGNRGLMVLDKDSEEFAAVTTPLSGLRDLQAQAQEHMAAVTGIPLVKLLGITPSGLNASSAGEMRAFYDWVEACQERLFAPLLQRLLRLLQLSLFGAVDPGITWRWESLWSLDEAELAAARKTEAETAALYVGQGVLSAAEVRAGLVGREGSPYAALDLE
ncbi:hypothetical protein GALL_207610 [mine drainage metagenome]|uniref:Anti-CBASS protein Acb1-like N-terminal domain-containing protein n=1 Tax=mine drainage metagenome TaxID=410659 RepID=A0A1J5RZ56_9ZZZZ